ncbi:chaperonin groEL [Maribacter phage Panino]
MNLKPNVRITEVVAGEETQKAILEGVNLLYTPVASTLGASGRTVIIEDVHGMPKPTKDGVTVAKAINPFESVERMASEIIKQASLTTAEEAGDGTTTSTIIAKGLVERGLELMKDKSINYTDFNKGMNRAVEDICNALQKQSRKITLDNIESVATISANNDTFLGGVIGDAFRKAGEHGVVLMEKSQTNETYVSVTEGFELEKGYKSDIFINQEESNRCEFDNAFILVSNVKIEKIRQIEPQVGVAMSNNVPLVIVSEMEEEVLAVLAMNVARKNIKCVVIEPTHFGVRRREILSDLAISTGAVLVDDQVGDNFDTLTKSSEDGTLVHEDFGLGAVDKVTVEAQKSVFFNETTQELTDHVDSLVTKFKKEKNPTEKRFLEERIAKISSAVAIVNVGASSSSEQSEIADRVDDAIHATRAALSEGIVAGGGVALHNVKQEVGLEFASPAEFEGYNCVFDTILDPLKVCLANGDIEYSKKDFSKKNHGVDVKTGDKGDMFKMGIIDPVKVTKSALKNGVSAASTLLSTTSIIVNLRRV